MSPSDCRTTSTRCAMDVTRSKAFAADPAFCGDVSLSRARRSAGRRNIASVRALQSGPEIALSQRPRILAPDAALKIRFRTIT